MRETLSTIPPHIQCRQILLTNLRPGHVVLDVGCGTGGLMSELESMGCSVSGVEINRSLVESCRANGLQVSEGRAERLPVESESVDAIVCSVVLPYVDQKPAIAEWARVLHPGGMVNATYHGIGYGLDYLTRGAGFKTKFYGFRMLANTAFHALTGGRLPGFLGDTFCQNRRRLNSYYRSAGLELVSELIVNKCAGLPVFFCHRLMKPKRVQHNVTDATLDVSSRKFAADDGRIFAQAAAAERN